LRYRWAEKNPNYKGLTELMQKQSNKDIRPALDGTTFSGVIRNSNLYLEPITIEISLAKFSDEIMDSFIGDKEVEDFFNSVLDEKLFTFFIKLDKNQKISQIVMQDIDKNIDDNGKTINVKFKNHSLDIDIKESLKGLYTLGEQSIKADKFLLNTKGIEYKFDYLTQFENSGSLHVDSLEIKDNRDILKIGNVDITNSIKPLSNNDLSVDLKYTIKDLYFKEQGTFELDSFIFNISVFGLDKDGAIEGSKAYNQLALEPTQSSIEMFTNAIQKILNRGFKANINTSLSGLKFQNITFDNSEFTLNFILNKNSYTLKDDAIINALLVSGKLSLEEKNIKDIIKLDRSLKRFVKLGKKEGSKVVFNYEFKQGNLLVNGNKI